MTTATYRALDEAKIIGTLERLRNRIGERFPDSGLRDVAEELITVAKQVGEDVAYIRSPNWPIRIAVAVVIAAMVAVLVMAAMTLQLSTNVQGFAEVVQLLEAGINDIVFFGIAVFFLVTIEVRMKRRRALRVIHQLRSLAHVVDMHQLTKDPERLLSSEPSTPSSPERTMTPPELGRYLDYCSELLSLTGKLSALLVQHFNDEVVLGAVNEIETADNRSLGEDLAENTVAGALSRLTRKVELQLKTTGRVNYELKTTGQGRWAGRLRAAG